ncbi:MAG: DUF302 domain-containing protein [Alphaproteobacteria bacterium]|nr:DUF302 domain-containing protein [Alphaproteobacteria bacterium]
MRLLILLLGLLAGLAPAIAGGTKTYTVKGTFDEVALDVESTIVGRGLYIDLKGNVSGMLQRTGKDVGSDKEIYKGANYYAFCSAVLSRKMMEADASDMGLCPYIVFVYETKAKPGEVVVGFRKVSTGGNSKSEKVLSEIDAWLDGMVREVAGG